MIFQKSLNKSEFQAASIPGFERSEFYVFNVVNNDAYKLILPEPISLYYKKQDIIEKFSEISDEEFESHKMKTYVIEDIDFKKEVISFFGMNRKIKTYDMVRIEQLPVNCNY